MSLLKAKSQEWVEIMKTLKFILWPILLFCLMWLSAISFGPSVISYATSYFSEGRVKLTRVKVTPGLKISAAVVDFVLPLGADEGDLNGASRALSIDWKVDGGFQLFGTIGPSSLTEQVTLRSTNFIIKPTSMFDWSDIAVKLEFKHLVGVDFEVLRGTFSGNITEAFKVVSDVEFVFPGTLVKEGKNSFETIGLTVSVARYAIMKPLILQNLEATFSAKHLALAKSGFEGSAVEGRVKLSSGGVDFKASVSDAYLKLYNLKAKSLTISSRHSSMAEASGKFSVSSIASKAPDLKIENYSGNFKVSPSGFSHNGVAIISDLELKTDQYLIGKIENGILDVALTSRILPSRIDVKGQIALSLTGADGFNASASVGSSISEVNIFDCFGPGCELDGLEAKYNVSVSGSALTGNLKCREHDCLNRPLLHVLQTDNTNKFFKALSETGILNPLSLSIAYLAISSGVVVGDGHVINF